MKAKLKLRDLQFKDIIVLKSKNNRKLNIFNTVCTVNTIIKPKRQLNKKSQKVYAMYIIYLSLINPKKVQLSINCKISNLN